MSIHQIVLSDVMADLEYLKRSEQNYKSMLTEKDKVIFRQDSAIAVLSVDRDLARRDLAEEKVKSKVLGEESDKNRKRGTGNLFKGLGAGTVIGFVLSFLIK